MLTAGFKVPSRIDHDSELVTWHYLGMLRNSIVFLAVAIPAQFPIAPAAENVHWRVNSLLAPELFGESGRILAEEVGRLTDGAFTIQVHDQLVLDMDAFEALRSGLVDAVWGSPGHHHREDPTLTIFGGFPFGPDPGTFTAWMKEGGGSKALNDLYRRHGLRSVYCGALPAEGGGWFRAPVERAEDLGELSMRAFGYGARTLAVLGTTTYELPGTDIRSAYEAGIIDAAEFAMPSIDAELGLDEMAPYLLLPGWQQPATSLELLVLETSWLELPESFRDAIAQSCDAVSRWSLDVATPRQDATIEGFRAEGVEIRQWPDDVLEALNLAWMEVIEAGIEDSPELGRVWQNYLSFLESYRPANVDFDQD
ncbi:TRAP transporter substrate-binding protein [Tropicimonas marinistellae]|uniref:TRAP transporter substrate-binding protein n=1 Tax=Tropicimonas marinistellae TaxID=1739787 RepID=UPI000B1BB7E9|nr:ABC transporter substrate-binding protein [Tropicimonas marinistellae]